MTHVNINSNRKKMSFSSVLYIVTFLIAPQPWAWAARTGVTGLMTAAASIKSPGEVDPKSLSILIGGNANITCRLSKPSSSDIWFYEAKTNYSLKQPSDKIQLIDEYAAMFTIHNATEQNSRYQCKVADNAIGEMQLFVGTKPQNVTDFSCITYNYDYMECSFSRPKNMVLTRFDLEYKFPKESSSKKCNCSDESNRRLKCNVTEYKPIRKEYLFTLKGTNDVGENVQHFSVNNNKIVIPSAVDVIIENITSESIKFSLEKLKFPYYKGLDYDVQIRDNNSLWQNKQRGVLKSPNGISNTIIIRNLYAFWSYEIKVRVKSSEVDNDKFWSDGKLVRFTTEAERPKRPPETPVGSFYIDSTETQLRLYWEQMPEYEYNGPAFQYIINEVNGYGAIINTTRTNESSITFEWRNESVQSFVIKSENEIGESTDGNIIRVYRSGSPTNELNENNIAKVYHNSSYTLSWSPPENINELINYTVFWCIPKIELPNQCKGPISYKYVSKNETSFTTEPKDRSLNLAISANYPHYNKGMQWARCSGDVSSELMKMELEVSALNESAILVKWSSGSVCASILKGYNLTYCQASDDGNCVKPEIEKVLLKNELHEIRNHTISNLPPYTNICLHMVMYSASKHGRSSDKNCIRTKASAPSPPKHVRYLKNTVTSKSAEIQWDRPDAVNGILNHYTIYWRKYPNNIFEKKTISAKQTSYNLAELNSYSNYEVYITAHTVEESVPSQRINFTTLIGIPSGPRNLIIQDNATVIYWDQPDLPSGQHLFYLVALVRRDEMSNSIYERVSIVRGRSCRFQQPDCMNSNRSYELKVRAVNVGKKDEVDQEISPMNKEAILEGASIDEDFCKSDKYKLDDTTGINTKTIFRNDFEDFYFASQWIAAPRYYSCPPSSNASMYAIALIIVIAFAAYLCCWLRSKYYKMKNIKVILPEGLVDQVSNYKFNNNTLGTRSELESSTKKEFHSDISRSNDCLVSFNQKENLNLVTDFHTHSSNALSLFSSSSSCKEHNEDQNEEHPSLETTNEEFSSNSSSELNSNLAYNDHRQIKRLSSHDSNNTLPVLRCEEGRENSEGESVHEFSTAPNNGYVTHNSHFLTFGTANNVSTTGPFSTTFPSMTTDGYIQPSTAKQLLQPSLSHYQPPPTSVDGYTCIEALGKLTTADESRHINILPSSITNSPVSNSASTVKTSLKGNSASVLTNPIRSLVIKESPHAECNKDGVQQNGTTVPISNTSHQANTNNHSICGYVTQQQLANFGTNVALGK